MNTGTIVICAPSDRWNDFGHQTLFDFSLVTAPGQLIWKRFRLAFMVPYDENKSEYDVFREVFERGSGEIKSPDNFPQFFTMQLNASAYAELTAELGEKTAYNVLKVMNDVVVAEHSEVQPSWLDAALKSSAFNLSFLRSPEGFLAYFEGNAALTGHASEFASLLPRELNLSFQLDGFLNPHEFKFSFDPDSFLPKRMAALIGQNGVGKSRTLNELVNAALRQGTNFTDEKGKFPNISKIIAICTPGETEATFPRVVGNNSAIQYIRLSSIPGEMMKASNETLPMALQKLARQDLEENSFRWDIFTRSVQFIVDFDELLIVSPSVLAEQENLNSPFGKVRLVGLNRGNEKLRLESAMRLDRNGILVRGLNGRYFPLSSGQLSFIRLAAQLCLHMSPGTLVLIDEPETHLHPRLVTEFISMLNSVIEITNSIAIVATHSAYFVREVPTSQVHVIKKTESGEVHVGRPRLKTLGSDVGAISDFVFEDDTLSRFIREVNTRIDENEDLSENWESVLGYELSTELIMYIKRSRINKGYGPK